MVAEMRVPLANRTTEVDVRREEGSSIEGCGVIDVVVPESRFQRRFIGFTELADSTTADNVCSSSESLSSTIATRDVSSDFLTLIPVDRPPSFKSGIEDLRFLDTNSEWSFFRS